MLKEEVFSELELKTLDKLVEVANLFQLIVLPGPVQNADLTEAYQAIHILQRMIMANGMARMLPDYFRPLGDE